MSMSAIMLGCDVVVQRYNRNKKTHRVFPKSLATPRLMDISHKKHRYTFLESASEKTIPLASAIEAKDKIRSKHVLAHAGITTPVGGAANATNLSALEYFAKAGVRSVIVKPATGSRSQGILERATLAQAKQHIIKNPKTLYIVEQFIPGHAVRAHVVGNEVVASARLAPISITGDGVHSVKELIQSKINQRKMHPKFYDKPMDTAKVLAHLRDINVHTSTVLAANKVLPLTNSSLPDDDSDTVWYLDNLTDDDKALAVRAASVLGLKSTGVDLMKSVSGTTYVLELNSKPGIGFLCMPTHGLPNLRVPEALLRWHFPKLGDQVHTIKRYDYLRLLSDYQSNTEQNEFSAADYVEFA